MRQQGKERLLWDFLEKTYDSAAEGLKPERRSVPKAGKTGVRAASAISKTDHSRIFGGIVDLYAGGNGRVLEVEFYSYVGLKHTIWYRNGTYRLRISDILNTAPDRVLRAVAHLMLGTITKRECPKKHRNIYSEYLKSPAVAAKIERTQRERGRKKIYGTQGKVWDLDEAFNRVNAEQFGGSLDRPVITWTKRRSRTNLGSYDEVFDTIAINRKLDSKHVPRYVLDYIMFHEMLHKIHPIRLENGRFRLHSPAFKKQEMEYKDYRRALAWLRTSSC